MPGKNTEALSALKPNDSYTGRNAFFKKLQDRSMELNDEAEAIKALLESDATIPDDLLERMERENDALAQLNADLAEFKRTSPSSNM